MNFLNAGAVGPRPKGEEESAVKQARAKVTLSMYNELPEGEVSIEEFERFAMDRLRVLKGIDDLRAKGFRPDQMQEKVGPLCEQYLKAGTREESARKDLVSHFVLRMAYCRTEDLRRWFIAQAGGGPRTECMAGTQRLDTQIAWGLAQAARSRAGECELFRCRFRSLLGDEQRAFMEANSLPYRPISSEEFNELKVQLYETLRSCGSTAPLSSLSADGYYKVPFEQVPDLVATRRVYLRGGAAYVPREHVSSLVVQPFRANLSKSLVVTARRWAAVVAPEEADRLAPIVESLSQRYLGPDYTNPEKRGVAGTVAAADVPALARQSFPLCMVNMYQARVLGEGRVALHDSHTLKHDGRMQFGLFLKGIGLPLEEAMRFWRTEMAQTAAGDKFDKGYGYNIRHNYGKEGNRKDYTPYSCMRIIPTTPGVGQARGAGRDGSGAARVHGCPYKTFAPDSLRAALQRLQYYEESRKALGLDQQQQQQGGTSGGVAAAMPEAAAATPEAAAAGGAHPATPVAAGGAAEAGAGAAPSAALQLDAALVSNPHQGGGPAPKVLRAAILLLTVLWPTLHLRSYLRWRTAALAFLRMLLISLPFDFSTEAFDAMAPGPVAGRLAALGNCFHYFIATKVALCIFAGLGWRLRWRLHVAVQTATVSELLLTSPVLDAATAGVHEAFSLLALPVVPPARSFIPETVYARRVAGLLLAWSLLGWLLPVLLLLPERDTRRRHAGGSGGGDASDGPRATAAAKAAPGVEERVRCWLGVLIRPGREAPSPELKLLTCAMHWWAVLLLTWIACCTAAPLFAPPPGAAGA
eukprot:scaffold2.g6989.t1